MTSTPGSLGALANSGPVALSFANFLGGSSASGGGAASGGLVGLSKFKAMTPPSLPLSHPPPSPSSYLNMASGFLDSPILLTPSLFPSPTTGSIPSEPFNWMGTAAESQQESVKEEQRQYPDFTFQTATPVPAAMAGAAQAGSFSQSSSMLMAPLGGLGDSYGGDQNPWSYHQEPATQTQPEMLGNGGYSAASAPPAAFREQSNRRSSDDGYNWRKYGQKQMKGSENPRSYYKCSFPGCLTKKKVERSPDGQVTEIVYKGAHNHPKPQSTRRNGNSSAPASSYVLQSAGDAAAAAAEHSFGAALSGATPVATPENSSGSFGDDEANGVSSLLAACFGADELDDDEPESKKWRKDGGDGEAAMSAAAGNRTVREPRVVVQTMSDVDVLDDGYRWRKYGQKVVKGNPNPRSYYKCTTAGCPVRKHVERACHDARAVVTTYEGKHNHDVPPARGAAAAAALYSAAAAQAQAPHQQQHAAAGCYTQTQGGGFGGFGGHGAFCGAGAPATTAGSGGDVGAFGLSGFGEAMGTSSSSYSSYSSYTSNQQQQQQSEAMYYAPLAKDEPRDDDGMAFFEQPLLF